jgi:sugar lactone lactonase YvrE
MACTGPSRGFITAFPQHLVWPDPPDAARLKYVGAVEQSWDDPQKQSLARSVSGLLFGPAAKSGFVTPHAVAVREQGRFLAVADSNARCVHVFDFGSNRYVSIGTGREIAAELLTPVGVTWAADQLCVADAELHAVVVVGLSGGVRAIGRDQLKRPAGIAYNHSNQLLYVSDAAAHSVIAFTLDGAVVYQFGTRGSATGELNFPAQIVCAANGDVVVADSLNFRIQRFSADGTPLGSFGEKGDARGNLALPKGVAIDQNDHVWVVDAQFENVQTFDREGQLLLAFGGEGHGPGEFWLPAGATVDETNRLWIADTYNRRVQVFQILP